MTTSDIVDALITRTTHKKYHLGTPMDQCHSRCQLANEIIQEDARAKQKGLGAG